MPSNESRQPSSSKPQAAREHVERHYRAIGIPALAAAAHMVSRPDKSKESVRHELPAILRDESLAA
jgi:hypothetical protein